MGNSLMKPSSLAVPLLAYLAALLLAALPSCSHAPDPVAPPNPPAEVEPAVPQLTLSRFMLGPGDEVEVRVWRQNDLNADCRVSPLGTITLPLVGNVQASGRNIVDVQDEITRSLATYYVEPRVTVGVKTLRSMKIYVLGEVQQPGIFTLEEPISMVQAVAMAGGFTIDARRDSVLLARGDLNNPQLRKLNLEAALERGNFGDNTDVFRGDIIYVPASTIANVERFFNRLQNIIRPFVDAERALIFAPEVARSFGGKDRRIVIAP